MKTALTLGVLLLTTTANASILDFSAGGHGLDNTRPSRLTGYMAFNPQTDEITAMSRLSFQGLLPWEIGAVDVTAPFSGTFDGDDIDITAKGGFVRHPECGLIGDFQAAGDVRRGTIYYTLQMPSTVPPGCTLADHFAENQTLQSAYSISVPEPSSVLLMFLGMLGIIRRWTARI